MSITEYSKSISMLLNISPNSVLNIIDGNISFLKKDRLSMDNRIKLFKNFLIISDIKRHQNPDVISNIKSITLIILFNEKSSLYINRYDDLEYKYLKILNKILSLISLEDLKVNNISDIELFNNIRYKFINLSPSNIFIEKRIN